MNRAQQNRMALAAAGGGLLATVATGLACLGPLAGILLGVGGLGFLTRFTWLRVPATLLTAALLAVGFFTLYRPLPAACAARPSGTRRLGRVLLWSATLLAISVNVFEYLIFPRL
jgi:hypothetical protein